MQHDLDRSLQTFSGGELTRASLARALTGDPDLLLLDEPTNHLDVASLEWLEQTLQALDAAVVLVAHDRWFLEAVGTSVLELDGGRGRFFKGPWHAWRKEKAARELALGRAVERQQAEIERLERFVDPLPGRDAGPPGAGARQEARQRSNGCRGTAARAPSCRSSSSRRSARAGRVRAPGSADRGRRQAAARRRRAVARARRASCRSSGRTAPARRP